MNKVWTNNLRKLRCTRRLVTIKWTQTQTNRRNKMVRPIKSLTSSFSSKIENVSFFFPVQNFKSISSKSRVQEMCKTWPMASQCVTCVTCCSVNIKARCWAVPRRRWARHSVESRQADPWIRMQSLASKSVELVVRGSSARPKLKIRFQPLDILLNNRCVTWPMPLSLLMRCKFMQNIYFYKSQ